MKLARLARFPICRFSTAARVASLPVLPLGDVESFRENAFNAERPVALPEGHFSALPAISKWFSASSKAAAQLNIDYFVEHGSVNVPLELTSSHSSGQEFTRLECPLSMFLGYVASIQGTELSKSQKQIVHQIYLAQCSLDRLPSALSADLPTPNEISKAGQGDIYDSSIWIGFAPTYTPLHKDPNPNLFVQLAGQKVIRIFEPQVGLELFTEARRRVGGPASASFRGEEMMKGQERTILDYLVWGDDVLDRTSQPLGHVVTVDAGDGVFIPKGWWHSVKGVGNGIVGSVNWWFR